MSTLPKISVIIVARNEEKNMKECLESVKWADEIVVVDDMSTDRTLEICEGYPNVKVFRREMEGLGPQKNFALSKASGEWILSLDADERVTPELREEILRKVPGSGNDGYSLKLKHLIFGAWVLDYTPKAVRLFRKGKGRFSGKKVHESVVLDGKAGVLEGLMIHRSSHQENIANYIEVYVNRYSSYTAEDLYEMGRRVTLGNGLFCFVLKPFFIFIQKYFFKRGFRDGLRGFLLSVFASFTYFASYAKLWEKQKSEKH